MLDDMFIGYETDSRGHIAIDSSRTDILSRSNFGSVGLDIRTQVVQSDFARHAHSMIHLSNRCERREKFTGPLAGRYT